MPGSGKAELYFVSAMMILILILCGATVIFFVKTYKKEMRDKRLMQEQKAADKEKALAEAQREDAAS